MTLTIPVDELLALQDLPEIPDKLRKHLHIRHLVADPSGHRIMVDGYLEGPFGIKIDVEVGVALTLSTGVLLVAFHPVNLGPIDLKDLLKKEILPKLPTNSGISVDTDGVIHVLIPGLLDLTSLVVQQDAVVLTGSVRLADLLALLTPTSPARLAKVNREMFLKT